MEQTYLIIGTVILGIIGAAIFVLAQPAQTKSRSAGGGMKPRGERNSTRCGALKPRPTQPSDAHTLAPCRVADDWHAQ